MASQQANFPHRYLLVVGGLSPQVVTESLYGLIIGSNKPFIPTEIHLITTSEGAHRARLSLLHSQDGYFHRFCRDYGIKGIRFTEEQIHTITTDSGPLDDIRTIEDNEVAADAITQLVREMAQDDQSVIHASIAGGRKTMGYYLGYAMSMFGREQDRLSHVLVEQQYESHPEFFYPTRESRVIHTRDNRPLDTKDALISLANIPFLRIRDDLPLALLEGSSGFSETVARTAATRKPPKLELYAQPWKLMAGDELVELQPSLLAFYLWIVYSSVYLDIPLKKPILDYPESDHATGYLSMYNKIRGEMADTERTESSMELGMSENFFAEKVSRINKELRHQLGKRLAEPYEISHHGSRGSREYAVRLDPSQVNLAVVLPIE